ncbi:MAG TPA: hypothetical protein VGL49_07945 [Acidimicrobiales bacterium]
MTASGIRATVRPLGAAGVGLLSLLVGAWGGIAVFVGPEFGYRPTNAGAWDWTMQNWLLHLIPGAVGLAAGLLIMVMTPRRRAGAGGLLGLPALLLVAAGLWFVIGPAAWPTFESSAPFALGASANMSFLNQLGSSLGPGLLLAIFGGMALKAGLARPAVAVAEPTAGGPLDAAPTSPGRAEALHADPAGSDAGADEQIGGGVRESG